MSRLEDALNKAYQAVTAGETASSVLTPPAFAREQKRSAHLGPVYTNMQLALVDV